jgi:hypothetical protein
MENSEWRVEDWRLAADGASLREMNKALEQLLCLLQMDFADLRGARGREIAALSAQFAEEVAGLREQFTEDIASARDEAVCFGSCPKDPDPTKQKRYGYLTSGGSQPRKADFTRCSGIFRLRRGSSTSEDSLEIAVPGKSVLTPDGVHRIAVDFARDCQGSVETFLRVKRLLVARFADGAVGIRLDIGSDSDAISIDANWMLVLYSSVESLRIPDWIEVIRADDFRFCPNLRQVIAGLQREIDGFRDCRKLDRPGVGARFISLDRPGANF